MSGPSGSSSSSSSTAMLWLCMLTANNIAVTLVNKAAFAKIDFQYPFALSALHMLCNAVGAWVALRIFFASAPPGGQTAAASGDAAAATDRHRHQQQREIRQQPSDVSDYSTRGTKGHPPSPVDSGSGSSSAVTDSGAGGTTSLRRHRRQHLDSTGRKVIFAFSFVFSLNIAIGNVSLRHVSVNFNQVMRSLVPAVTIAMGWMIGKSTSVRKQLAVLPVIVGVAMACFGDLSFSALGLVYTVGCVVLAALKVVASGELMTGRGLRLHPIDLLGHVAPYAFLQCLALAWWTGEVDAIAGRWSSELSPFVDPRPLAVVLLSGILSFSMNICSLQANKLTSPLCMCIAGNVKQVLLIIISTIVFEIKITPLNGAGIVVVLIGSAIYSYISVLEKAQQNQHQGQKTTPQNNHNRAPSKKAALDHIRSDFSSTESTASASSSFSHDDNNDVLIPLDVEVGGRNSSRADAGGVSAVEMERLVVPEETTDEFIDSNRNHAANPTATSSHRRKHAYV